MGKTYQKVILKNFGDILKNKEGILKKGKIRKVEVDAIVDTGAAYLCLPPKVIENLGLLHTDTKPVKTANGIVKRRIFSVAAITINGRTIQMDVMENDGTTPPLIGYLVLEEMDFVVEPRSHKIIPNPANDGKWIVDCYYSEPDFWS
ncbi:MAG: retropepsin-like aspartic protease [Candidatus Hydrogenedentota bacterium]